MVLPSLLCLYLNEKASFLIKRCLLVFVFQLCIYHVIYAFCEAEVTPSILKLLLMQFTPPHLHHASHHSTTVVACIFTVHIYVNQTSASSLQ